MIVRRVIRFVDDRLGASRFARSALDKVFPDHWSFMLGEIALYSFVVLVGTGTFLTFFFKASPELVRYHGAYVPLRDLPVSEAYRSVMNLSFDVRAGLVMRQTHHWAAVVFIAAIVAHLVRVFFTGAFRRPREVNWMIGLTLMILAIFNGFTGYSLPDDLLSGTSLRIAYSIALSIPVIGTWAAFLLFGGEFPAHDILSRLYVIHIMLIPGAIVALLAAHMAILWRQKHTQFPGPGRTETNIVGSRLWPSYAAKSTGLFFAVAAVLTALGGLAQINPIWLYGPFQAAAVSSPSQPDWYLGWMEGALRLFPPVEIRAFGFTIPNPFLPAILFPGITFTMLYLWPFLEQLVTGDGRHHELLDRPRDRPWRTSLGAGTLTFYTVLLLAGANDVIARRLGFAVGTVTSVLRILLVAMPVVVIVVAYRVCRALTATEAPSHGGEPLHGSVHAAAADRQVAR